jgi:hypothetical protein
LHTLDEVWTTTEAGLGVLVRYCDDFVILCVSRARAQQARARVEEILATLGLRLHPGKTRIVHLAGGAQGFDFLGFHHHKVESWKRRGRWYLHRWPSDRAMASIRAKVRDRTQRRYVSRPISTVVEDLNPVLRGWGNHFRGGNSARRFATIDRYVHERLAILASNKEGRRGRNWHKRFTSAWFQSPSAWFQSLGAHQLSGTVRYYRTVLA